MILVMSAGNMSGVVRSVFDIAQQMATSHEVEIIAVVRRGRRSFFARPKGVRLTIVDDQVKPPSAHRRIRTLLSRWPGRLVHPTDKRAKETTLWTDLRLARRLRRLDADVIIATRLSLVIIGSRFARPGVVVIAEEQMNLLTHGPWKLEAIRNAYPAVDAVVVLTETDRRAYEAMLGGRTRVVCIPNPVPAAGGSASEDSYPVILGAGRLNWQKGFDRLIEAFAAVAQEEPQWTLRICGKGPARNRLREQTVDLGIEDRVQLAGPVPDLVPEMEHASVFALSSRFEGFPLVLLEAMSKGLPVVAFDCPTGPADIVANGRTGHLVPDGDTNAFAAALLDLVGDEEKRRRFGTAAAEQAKAFSAERIGAMWTDLLAELVSTRRRPGQSAGAAAVPGSQPRNGPA